MSVLLVINVVSIAMLQQTKASKQAIQVANYFNHKVNGSFNCIYFYRSFKLNMQDIWESIYKSDRVFTLPRAFILPIIKTIPSIGIK